jgi:hypothetical protein
VLAPALVALLAADASAIRYQPRPNWTIGVAFGVGTAKFDNVPDTPIYKRDGAQSEYNAGALPEIHIGRMLGEHFQIGVSYEAWLTEFGIRDPQEPDKIRRTLQNLSIAFAVFPGNQHGASGGIFLRAGVGLGWAGTGFKEVHLEGPQDEGVREDDWGVGVFGEGGYEFWIAKNATAGLSATYNYFDLSGDHIVSKAWFAGIVINFNIYF